MMDELNAPLESPIVVIASETQTSTSPSTVTAFGTSWSPSKTAALDSSRVQLADHVPRAWERAPRTPSTEDSRFKKVWKCHSVRSQTSVSAPIVETVISQSEEAVNLVQSPQRTVKRMRVGSHSDSEDIERSPKRGRSSAVQYVGTRWDERNDILPRTTVSQYQCSLLTMEGKHHEPTQSEKISSPTPSTEADTPSVETTATSNSVEQCTPPMDVARPIAIEQDAQIAAIEEVDALNDFSRATTEQTANELLHADINETIDRPTISEAMTSAGTLAAYPEVFGRSSSTPHAQEVEPTRKQVSPTSSVTADFGHEYVRRQEVLLAATSDLVAESKITADCVDEAAEDERMEVASPNKQKHIEAVTRAVELEASVRDPVSSHGDVKVAGTVYADPSQTDTEHELESKPSDDDGRLSTDLTTDMEVARTPAVEASKDDVGPVMSQLSDAPQPPIPPIVEGEILEDVYSPSPAEEGATPTLTSQHYLDEEKAYLESFLDRAAASKASKASTVAEDDKNCTDKEHAQNRRDSDAVRQALASPVRLPLEEKDTNVFSPKKGDQDPENEPPSASKKLTPAAIPELVLPPIDDLLAGQKEGQEPRRSVRSRNNRSLGSSTASYTGPHQINLRRGDVTETLTFSLNKTEAQQAALDTRKNTRKNKGTALAVTDRLLKWQAELAVLGKDGLTPEPRATAKGVKGVRWSESLEFLNEITGKPEQAPLVNNEQSPTVVEVSPTLEPVEPGLVGPIVKKQTLRSTRSATSKVRRLRSTANATVTPTKAVLSATLMPDEMNEHKIAEKNSAVLTAEIAVPTTVGGLKNTETQAQKGPTLSDITALGANPASLESKALKSRLQPPKKSILNPITKSVTPIEAITSKIKTPSSQKPSMLPVAGSQLKKAVRKT